MVVRVYIVEDNELMREMLVEFINGIDDLAVAGKAATAEEAFEALRNVPAELVLIDMALPGMTGAELVRKLLDTDLDLPCLIYSGHREAAYIEQALAAGARGYLLKGTPLELPQAIRRVLAGEIYVSSALHERS